MVVFQQVACLHRWQQIRVRVGHSAQSDARCERKTTHRRFAGEAGRIVARHGPPARGFAREVVE
jgi:hypothetical protein